MRPLHALIALAASAAVLAGCGSDDGGGTAAPATSAGASGAATLVKGSAAKVRLGYFPNVTHASALVGVEKGFFQRHLPTGTTLETKTFNAGPAAVEALFSEALDITYIGPNPAINAFQQSKGKAIRIISGATSGGAALVTKTSIGGPADLKGKKIASPQLGGTQDVALRAWLKGQGLTTDAAGGGDVAILPQENAQTLEAFKTGDIDGAWVPEPWAVRLVQEGGGKVLVDEKALWPNGRFVTTHVIVRTKFLEDHPDVVKGILEGQVEANDFLRTDRAEAQAAVGKQILAITTKAVPEGVLSASLANLELTNDPVAPSLRKSFEDAKAVGLLRSSDTPLDTIYDLKLLNEVLRAKGEPAVAS